MPPRKGEEVRKTELGLGLERWWRWKKAAEEVGAGITIEGGGKKESERGEKQR